MEINIKTLIKNSGILVVSNASLKVISFLLLPLYTSALAPEVYGVTDTALNLSALMAAVFSLSLDWGINTYFYEENSDSYYKKITSSGLFFFFISALACASLAFFSRQFSLLLFKKADFHFAVVLGLLVSSMRLLYFPQRINIRMRGKLSKVGLFGVIELSTILTCNILFILVLDLGYFSIILSNLTGQAVSMILYTVEARGYLSVKSVDRRLLKKMLLYSAPITPSLVFNWINTFLDRYFVGQYFSQREVGLYGIGTRMVGVLMVLTEAFLAAYPSFAYSNAKKKENRARYDLVLDLMVMGLTGIAAFFTLFSKEIVQIMTTEAYYSSYIVIGLLLFAHVLHVLGSIVGYGVNIQKKGFLYLCITGSGAFLNIAANFWLVPRYSFVGAAAATLVTEFCVFLVSYYLSKRLFDCGYHIKRLLLCVGVSLITVYGFLNAAIYRKAFVLVGIGLFISLLYRNRVGLFIRILKEKVS